MNYLWRHTGDGFVYVIAPDGLLHRTTQRSDEYDSTSVVVRQTLAKGFEWMSSYTYSRAFSNSVLNLNVDQTTQVVENFGAVPWDAPHRFLASAYLPVPKFKWLSDNWAVAMLAELATGGLATGGLSSPCLRAKAAVENSGVMTPATGM